ncbi:putative Aquaporin-10 [Hypsibius exemplaris]|uniref:Aquaporin-10 n=1 Tax=Hypsibius exemplaris TaxID=2072580 RepID=A0A1W0X1C7_HYPEX|nr:putative Aquaporin-10 [Hypsibius exemplaris]
MSRITRHGSHASLAKKDFVVHLLRIENPLVRGTIAEFFSAFVFIFFVLSTQASTLFSGRRGDMLLNAVNNGIAVSIAMFVSGGVTGAFLNPAVTLAWAVIGKLRWTCCIFYSIAQFVGAFAAAAVIYVLYYDALQSFDGGHRELFGSNGTAGLYGTYPADHQTFLSSIINELVGSGILLIAVLSVSDRRNWRPDNGLFPLVNGLIIVALNLAFYGNGGVAMNPARDLSPRLFSYFSGWGEETFSLWNYQWFWIPFAMPYAGAIIGALMYEVLIEFHWSPELSHGNHNESGPPRPDEGALIQEESVTAIQPIHAFGSPVIIKDQGTQIIKSF